VGKLSEARSPVAPAPRVGDPPLREEQRAPGKDNINFDAELINKETETKNRIVEESCWRMIDPQRQERERSAFEEIVIIS